MRLVRSCVRARSEVLRQALLKKLFDGANAHLKFILIHKQGLEGI